MVGCRGRCGAWAYTARTIYITKDTKVDVESYTRIIQLLILITGRLKMTKEEEFFDILNMAFLDMRVKAHENQDIYTFKIADLLHNIG